MIREIVVSIISWFAVLILSGVLYHAILCPIITRKERTAHGKALLGVMSFGFSAVLGVITASAAMWFL